MTCPQSVRVDAGVPYEFECQIFNESRYQEGTSVEPDDGDSIESTGDRSYVLKVHGRKQLPATEEYVSARLLRRGDDRVRYVTHAIDVKMRYSPILHIGPGLLGVQVLIMLIVSVFYLEPAASGKLSTPDLVRKAFVAIDLLYLTSIMQFVLLAAFFFAFTWSRAGYPNLDNNHWTSFLAYTIWLFLFAWLIFYMRWRFFERPVPVEWRRWPKGNESTVAASSGPSTVPKFIVVIIVGLLTCLVALPINAYWFGWFGF